MIFRWFDLHSTILTLVIFKISMKIQVEKAFEYIMGCELVFRKIWISAPFSAWAVNLFSLRRLGGQSECLISSISSNSSKILFLSFISKVFVQSVLDVISIFLQFWLGGAILAWFVSQVWWLWRWRVKSISRREAPYPTPAAPDPQKQKS